MAEAIGLASGILALANFALQSSITLYNTVQSFQSHPKRVRDLLEELEAFSGVLGPVSETASAANGIDLSSLDVPLLRCGNACKEFEQELLKCSSRSGGSRTSFRDWAKLRYMGEDIDGFRRLLAGYKLTISIALTDANLRKSSITTESLESYKDLVKTTTEDLRAHLESIDEKLEIIFKQTGTESHSDAAELILIKEERLSTQRCLQICDQLSEHINQIQLTPKRTAGSSSGAAGPDAIPERITNEGLQECKDILTLTAAKLEGHMKDVIARLVAISKTAMTSDDEIAELARLQAEWESTRQNLDIMTRANNTLKENVSTIDNYATGDAIQFMVSTNGKVLHGQNRGLGWRTRQVGGYYSDDAVVQISRDLSRTVFQNSNNNNYNSNKEGPSVRRDTSPASAAASAPDDAVESKPVSEFRDRYGPGVKLTSASTPDVRTITSSSTALAESGKRPA